MDVYICISRIQALRSLTVCDMALDAKKSFLLASAMRVSEPSNRILLMIQILKKLQCHSMHAF